MDELPWFLTHKNPEALYTKPERFMVLDFETDSEDKGDPLNEQNDLVLACWQVVDNDGTATAKSKFGGIYEMQDLLDDIAECDFVVCHNAKFEMQWLRNCGAELRDILPCDTMLMAWVLDGNQKKPRSLNALAARYGVGRKMDVVSKLIESGVSPREIPERWLHEYCALDVELTKQVFLHLRAELTEKKLWHLVHVRNLTCAALADIEFEGLTLDATLVQEEYMKALATKEELEGKLLEMTGGINLGSSKQLAEYLYDKLKFAEALDFRGKPIRTAKDGRTVNAKVLPLLKAETEEQQRFMTLYKDYNKATTLLEKSLEFFKNVVDQKGGTFYGVFNQGVVASHRLSSSGRKILFDGEKKPRSLQLQNIPREFKKLFCSGDEDWLVVEGDGGQLEFRVAADMTGDSTAQEEIANEVDVHSITAATLTEAGEPTSRQEAKAHTFRPLYGGGQGSPAVVEYCEFFKQKYHGIASVQKDWTYQVLNDKQLRTPYGMIFYWPDTKAMRSGYITNTTQIYNLPVQGFATGEIIPIALVHFWHRSRGKPIKIFSTIHDSIVSKVHKDSVKEAEELIKISLTDDVFRFLRDVYDYQFTTVLGVGIKAARNWGYTKKEVKYNVAPDGSYTRKEE